jgi:hypothetical protein
MPRRPDGTYGWLATWLSMRKRNQDYEVSAIGVVHLPAKARFVPALSGAGLGTWEDGKLGTPLGGEYTAADIKKTMVQLWRDYLRASA